VEVRFGGVSGRGLAEILQTDLQTNHAAQHGTTHH
jgi:Bacterial SH3 domain